MHDTQNDKGNWSSLFWLLFYQLATKKKIKKSVRASMCQFPCRTTSSPANKNPPMDAHLYCWYFKSWLCLNLTRIPSGFFFFFSFPFCCLRTEEAIFLFGQTFVFNFRFSHFLRSPSLFLSSRFFLHLPSTLFQSSTIEDHSIRLCFGTYYCHRWTRQGLAKIKSLKKNGFIGCDGEKLRDLLSLETMAFPFMRAFLAVL